MLCYQKSPKMKQLSASHTTPQPRTGQHTLPSQVSQHKRPANSCHLSNPLQDVTEFKAFCHSKKSYWLWLITLHLSVYVQTTGWQNFWPQEVSKHQQVGRALFFGKNNPTFTCFFKHTETPSHACVHYIPIQTFKSCTVFSSNNPHIKSQNIPSWKGPVGIIESKSCNPEHLGKAESTLI